jgi:hypothetical protein
MPIDIDHKRRELTALDKQQLVELVAHILAAVEAFAEGNVHPIRLPDAPKGPNAEQLSLTKAWTLILRRLSDYKHFRANDVILVSREFERDGKISRVQSPGSARAQLCLLTQKGIIKRLGGGNYFIPDSTKQALKKSPAKSSLGRNRRHGSSPKSAGDAR